MSDMTKDQTMDVSGPESPKSKRAWIIAGILIAALLALYIILGFYFQSHFFFRTFINGVPASGASVQTVKERLANRIDDYVFTVVEEDGSEESIDGKSIRISAKTDSGEIEAFLGEQNAMLWPQSLFTQTDYVGKRLVTYDASALKDKVAAMHCVNRTGFTQEKDATYKIEGDKFVGVPEVYGTRIDADDFSKRVGAEVKNLNETLDLQKDECYKQPDLKMDSDEFKALLDNLNEAIDMNIEYEAGETVSKEEMADWLDVAKDGTVSYDESKVEAFVAKMAKKYNTYGKDKTLQTSYDKQVKVPGGNYGWQIDEKAELKTLLSDLEAKKDVRRDFEYSHTAATHGDTDYGDSYVEVCLSSQHLFLYVNGKQVLDSPFVSGNIAKGRGTHVGAYSIAYKKEKAVLKGADYQTPVDYWMPFNGGEGLHDAKWRSSFGGNIFRGGGSHGCVNLPHSVAKQIFGYVDKGFPVLVYSFGGTDNLVSPAVAAAYTVIDVINSIGEVTPEKAPIVANARARFNALSAEGKAHVSNLAVLEQAEMALGMMMPPPEPAPAPAPAPEAVPQ